jgi:hypothetical protein
MLSDPWIDSRPNLYPGDMAWDEGGQRALVINEEASALLAIDAVTGERAVISH